MKKLFLLLLTIISFSCFSQTKEQKIIKDKIKEDFTIYSTISDEEISKIISSEKQKEKAYVLFENKFYSVDTLKLIKNVKDYNMDIIKIPENISKDLSTIIVLKKAVK